MTRVLVAGAGPVGLTAALVLARRGIAVTVLEAGDALATESRASTFHPPSLEMLADLGVVDELIALGSVSTGFQYRDRHGGPIAELDLGVLADDTPYPFRVQCEQGRFTPIVLEHLARHAHASVHFGRRVAAVEQQDGVEVRTQRGERWRADWLIAADGAGSAVRRSLGVEFAGMTYPERFLVVSTDEDLDALLPELADVNYVYDPHEWMVLLRTPDHWRVLLPTDPDSPDDVETAPDRVQQRLRSVADPGRAWSVLHTSLYRVHQRVCGSFLVGRTLLVGDAAHVNNPLGGMGMNSGLHDAVLLGTALADHLDGSTDLDDLRAVAEQRREVAVSYVRTVTHQNWRDLRETDASARAAHHEHLRRLGADKGRMRDHLLRSSMIDSLRVVAR